MESTTSSAPPRAINMKVADILAVVDKHHDKTFGFVVYRCTYEDQERWNQILRKLDDFVSGTIAERRGGELLREHLVWDVRDDSSLYKDATMSQIRGYFNDWVSSVNGHRDLTRYAQCIYADNDVVDAVLDGEDAFTEVIEERLHPRAYVKIINSEFEARPDAPFRQGDGTTDAEDGGFEPIEGDRREDVGWMKVAACTLVPRAYAMMLDFGWELYYARSPVIQYT